MKKLENGFTLIEILVATTLFSLIGYLAATQLGEIAKFQKRAKFNLSAEKTVYDLKEALKTQGVCRANFSGMELRPNTPLNIDNLFDASILTLPANQRTVLASRVSEEVGYDAQVTDINIQIKNSVGVNRHLAELVLTFTDPQASQNLSLTKSLSFIIFTDSAGLISDCQTNIETAMDISLSEIQCRNRSGWYFDQADRTCKVRYQTVCYNGTERQAQCTGAGTMSYTRGTATEPALTRSCRMSPSPRRNEEVTAPRDFPNGRITGSQAPDYVCLAGPQPFSVVCSPGLHVTVQPNTVCSVCCETDMFRN